MSRVLPVLAASFLVLNPLTLIVACGDDSENGDPPGGNGAIPQEHEFEEDEWYLYYEEVEAGSEMHEEHWGYGEDGNRGASGWGTTGGTQNFSVGMGRSTEEWPHIVNAIWLTEGSGPATVMLYKGHDLVDEITLEGSGDRGFLLHGDVEAADDPGSVSVPDDTDTGEFKGVFSGLGYDIELEGEASYQSGGATNTVSLSFDSATADDPLDDVGGNASFSFPDDELAPGTYSSDEEDPDVSHRDDTIRWSGFTGDNIEYEECDFVVELTEACGGEESCAGELTLTNCLAEHTSGEDPFPYTVGFANAAYRFETGTPLF